MFTKSTVKPATPRTVVAAQPVADDRDTSNIPCPHCGNFISLEKSPRGPVVARKTNASRMPMDQLKSVIQAERGE